MPGKLIVIEGTDGSGKATQSKLLFEKLVRLYPNREFIKAEFPRYHHPMAYPVEAHLRGEFGDANQVGPFASSLFYLVDQYAATRTDWPGYYSNNAVVISDRYYTANLLHQSSKLNTNQERDNYINWFHDLVNTKLEMPKPDLVLYLHVPSDVTEKLILSRVSGEVNQKTGIKNDIYEKDIRHQRRCKQLALSLAEKEHWRVIQCATGDNMRPVQDIHQDILTAVLKILNETD